MMKIEANINYGKIFILRRKDNDHSYSSPELKRTPASTENYSQQVRIKIFVPPFATEKEPVIEMIRSIETNTETRNRLLAYNTITGMDLKVEIEQCGTLIIELDQHPCVKARILLDSHIPVKAVVPTALYVLHRENIEWIVLESIYDLRNSIQMSLKKN